MAKISFAIVSTGKETRQSDHSLSLLTLTKDVSSCTKKRRSMHWRIPMKYLIRKSLGQFSHRVSCFFEKDDIENDSNKIVNNETKQPPFHCKWSVFLCSAHCALAAMLSLKRFSFPLVFEFIYPSLLFLMIFKVEFRYWRNHNLKQICWNLTNQKKMARSEVTVLKYYSSGCRNCKKSLWIFWRQEHNWLSVDREIVLWR